MAIRDRNLHPEAGSRQDAHVKRVTSAQVLALNATPVEVVPAPAAGYANIFLGATVHKPAGTAYAGIAATEEVAFKYTNGSGLNLGTAEATGFLDQTTAQTRYVQPHVKTITTDTPTDVTPLTAAIVAHMVVGEITTGTSDLVIKVFYRTIKLVPDESVLGS